MFDYQGKYVVVVGGTSGINLCIAKAFAVAGAMWRLPAVTRKKWQPRWRY